MKTIKVIVTSIILLGIAVLLWSVFYPDKSKETKTSLEAIGAVGLERVISSMEDQVGKTDVALEHYKQALSAQRKSLVTLKGAKRDCEQRIAESSEKIASFEGEGNTAAAASEKKRHAQLTQQLSRMETSISTAEERYKNAVSGYDDKKRELLALREKSEMLRAELSVSGGGESSESLERARQLEAEIKSECNRIEAELDVLKIEEDVKG